MSYLETVFLLIIGHAIADFALQSDTMAKGKNRNREDRSLVPPGQVYTPTWGYWLSAHSAVHAGMVYLITGSTLLATLELVLHFAIDYGKCENWYGVNQDQAKHIICKFIWAGFA